MLKLKTFLAFKLSGVVLFFLLNAAIRNQSPLYIQIGTFLSNYDASCVMIYSTDYFVCQTNHRIKITNHLNNNTNFASQSYMSKFQWLLSNEDESVCKDIASFVTICFSLRN